MKMGNPGFTPEEKKYLDAMCRMFYQSDKQTGNKHMAVAWGLTAGNIGKGLPLLETQLALLAMAVNLSIKQGEKLHQTTQDLAVRVKAGAILEAYTSIKQKLENVVYTEVPEDNMEKSNE